ncbi:MAG: hypothetical protein GY714_10500 [Desulfobacterales bacterium]|nr:hypothetical protein [Desulfobacterales bacterium]
MPFEIIDEKKGIAKTNFSIDLVGNNSVSGEPIQLSQQDEENENSSDEEFFRKKFRNLSMTVTPSRFFDFTEEGMLKKAVPLFENLTIYANHNADVNNWKGFTEKPYWDEENDPPGVNSTFVFDKTVDSRLARGVEIGALRSASVTIWFKFKKSHENLRYYYDHIGTEVDGELVRLIITEITQVGEVSVVYAGEDPFAKALTKDNKKQKYKGEEMKLSKGTLELLDLSEEPSSESFEKTLKQHFETQRGLKSEVKALKVTAEIGENHLSETREKAVTLYKASKGESFKQDYIDKVIKTADLETAKAFVGEFQETVDEKAPLSCLKCGEKLSRRSSKDDDDTKQKPQKDISNFKIS